MLQLTFENIYIRKQKGFSIMKLRFLGTAAHGSQVPSTHINLRLWWEGEGNYLTVAELRTEVLERSVCSLPERGNKP